MEWCLSDNLLVEWEGCDIVVMGVICGLFVVDEIGV